MKKTTIALLDQKKPRPDFKPPTGLPKALHSDYRNICNLLFDGGRFHETDARLVGEYLECLYTAAMARKVFQSEGMLLMASQGPKSHPAIAVMNNCLGTAAKLASTLGLGPAHRHKIGVNLDGKATAENVSGWERAASS